MAGPRNLRADAFEGAAEAYLRYRPPYPRALLADLLARCGTPPDGVLLDLASGPGRVALDLAGAVGEVLAVDLEPGMVAAGRGEAAQRRVGNVSWWVGAAEAAPLPSDSVDLITIGEAFHRLDQMLIARRGLRWLKPGGCLVTLGCDGLLAGGEAWKATVAEVAHRWMDEAFPDGWGQGLAGARLGAAGSEQVLREAGFADVQTHAFAEPRHWTLESVIGYLRSTSVCSHKALGSRAAAFEADLRAALSSQYGPGPFHEVMGCSYTLGRRPSGGR